MLKTFALGPLLERCTADDVVDLLSLKANGIIFYKPWRLPGSEVEEPKVQVY